MKRIMTTTIGKGLNLLSHIAPEKTGELGFNLFCYPQRPPLKEKHRKFLETGLWKKITHEQHEAQLYKWGEGPTSVFFAHGWQSHVYRWKPYIHQLNQEKFTVYAMDAPGHGLSSGKFLNVPLYGEMIEKTWQHTGPIDIFVGHSMGSFSLLYALQHLPTLTPKGMVLLAPPSNARDFFDFYRSVLQLSDRTVNLTIDHFIQHFNEPPEYFSTSDFARGLQLPGLIIHDEGDMETPVKNAYEIHKAWPQSKLQITSGFGHNLRSHEVVQSVTDFIQEYSRKVKVMN